jgi:hypothetical protein
MGGTRLRRRVVKRRLAGGSCSAGFNAGLQSRARANSTPRRLDFRRAVAESRGRTRRCRRRVGS